ncbi:hypothetical protein DRO97_07770 [Archaeoglobales archaeon]|nr:MAG: hypothetical protein DRO97_07770 [Archaeoglobales archaeon]
MVKVKEKIELQIPILAILLILPLFTNFYYFWLFTLASIFASYTLSWYLMEKFCGRTSLGHTLPFGLTAYLSAIAYFFNYPLQLLPLVALIVALLSTFIFYITSMLDRVKFVFATFLYSVLLWEIAPFIVLKKDILYGGEEGFSIALIPPNIIYILSSTLLIAVFVFTILLHKSSLGLKMMAVRDDEEAALAIGIDVKRIKLLNSFISSLFTSFAGLIYILHFSHIDPDVFSVENAIFPFIASVFAGNFVTPVLGSYLLIFASKALNTISPQFHLVLYALLLIISPKLRRISNAHS